MSPASIASKRVWDSRRCWVSALLIAQELAAEVEGSRIDVEDGVRTDHVHVAVDALQLVVEEVSAGAARFHHISHDVAGHPHHVCDRHPQLEVIEKAELDLAAGV